jgi:hypothetical protein
VGTNNSPKLPGNTDDMMRCLVRIPFLRKFKLRSSAAGGAV